MDSRSFEFGFLMILVALVANGDSSLMASVFAALGLAKAAHQIVIVDGNPNH